MKEQHTSRQSFLGADSDSQISSAKIGIVGLGGGGSHVAQQLAHVGFSDYVLFDPDIVKRHNLNRLVGGTIADAGARRKKIAVANRTILGLRPDATVEAQPRRWQEKPRRLRECDIVFGCTDGFNERRELEAFTRRHLIPYIDIGLDVHQVDDEPPRMAGQVILSMPGHPCMWCMGFLTERGSSEKFVLFIGRGDMFMLNGRDIVARDFWCVQELPFHQDGGETWWRVCGGRASGQALPVS